MSHDYAAEIRRSTLGWASQLRLPVSDILPAIEASAPVRSSEDVAARLLCLYVTAATAYGCGPEKGVAWLEGLDLDSHLTSAERTFIFDAGRSVDLANRYIEAVWTLCWALAVCESFAVEARTCPDDLISHMPSMLVPGTGQAFVARAHLRDASELHPQLDRAYYLHWVTRDALLHGHGNPSPAALPEVEWRRRALEWIFDPEEWDDISLDT